MKDRDGGFSGGAGAGGAGGRRGPRLEDLLARHRDQLIVGVCVFRMVAALVPLADPATPAQSPTRGGLVALTVLIIAVNAVVLFLTPRFGVSGGRWVDVFLVTDLGLAVMLNVAGAAIMPATALDPIDDTFWYLLQGSVACIAAVRGLRLAVVLVVLGFPFSLLMAWIGEPPTGAPVASKAVLCTLWLVLALVCSMMVMNVARLHATAALGEGLHAGADAEQARLNRALHDTVLQTLEAIALRAAPDADDPAGRLGEVRHYARRQAADLRRVIDESWPTGDQGLYAGLSDVVDEARDHGLHVDFRCPQAPDVPPAQVAAACDAVREALTNVLKHARTDRAVVRAEPRRGGLLVVVSDAGRGFDPLRVGPGFGIRESIIGRTADVRGHAEVRSRAGHGTEVTLWFEDGQHGRRGADPGHRDGGGPRTPGRGLGRITHPEGSGRRHAAR